MTQPLFHPEGMSHEQAILSTNEDTACLGRIALSRMAEEMIDLVRAELARGTSPATLLIALARFQVQVHASVTAQVLTEEGIRSALQAYRQILAESYEAHARRTSQHFREAGP